MSVLMIHKANIQNFHAGQRAGPLEVVQEFLVDLKMLPCYIMIFFSIQHGLDTNEHGPIVHIYVRTQLSSMNKDKV